ncbi:MAG: Eco57I restriction-modification methylase domain-containing protein, partial [Aestuariivirga sp.]
MLHVLQGEGRRATPDEQQVLVKYVGWGGLKQAFNQEDKSWDKEYRELADLLTPAEYAAARASTLNAHYTSRPIVRGVWAALAKMGFSRGRVLEPAAGIGHFIGLAGAARSGSSFTAIELDTTTGAILKHLYQRQNVLPGRGFQEVNIRSGSYDVAVGNPPFGSESLSDQHNKDLPRGLSIHNFFFAKSIDALREGGILAMVVSNSFMDAKTPIAREWIADRTKLLGAIRLPNNAFLENAGTEVTTDIVFLQKLPQGEAGSRDWVTTGEYENTQGEKMPLNAYFIAHPDMMLGDMKLAGTMYRSGTPALVARPGMDLENALAKAIEQLPADVFKPQTANIDALVDVNGIMPATLKVGGLFVTPDGKIGQRLPDVEDRKRFAQQEPKSATQLERVKGVLGVRDALRTLMRGELSNDPKSSIEAARKKLNGAYDAFVKRHGYINNAPNRLALRDEVDLPLLESLEADYNPGLSEAVAAKLGEPPRGPSATKADIFAKRVLFPYAPTVKAETPKDALLASLNERGRIDLPFMSKLLGGRSSEDILRGLKGLVYLDPDGSHVHADVYLGGPVKAKLALAQAALDAGREEFRDNVEALSKVIPPDIEALDISVRLGSPWVPGEDVAAFANHLLKGGNHQAHFIPAIGRWSFEGHGDNVAETQTWGTPRKSASSLIDDLLANRVPMVRDNMGTSREPNYVVNQAETAAAQAKADEIAQAFKDWLWADADRRERLARFYNDTYNTEAPKKYDGAHLTLPGSSPAFQMRPHQKNAIWRALQDRTFMLDHVVGAGKTAVGVATVMESRRLGIARKPMLVVPNHLVRQWRDDFYRIYPNANILATTEKDFDKANRQRLFSRITTGDWDAVIVARDSFKKIGMPEDAMQEVVSEQLTDIMGAIEEAKRSKSKESRNLTRELESIRAGLQEKLNNAKQRGGKKDAVVTFDELGVDGMFVDEAHEFKNLFFFTSMRTAGLGSPQGSSRAFDLFVKTRYLNKAYGGQALMGFATGTPVSNSLVEMFTMQRFLAYDALRDRGIHTLDGWAGSFGNVANVYEVDTSGTGYRMKSRFAQFVNMPELMSLYRSFADVITTRDLEEQSKAQGKVWPVPKIKGGRPQLIVADRSAQQARFFGEAVKNEDGNVVGWTPGSILDRIDSLPHVKDPRIDNMLKITNDARKAGLDYRLVDSAAGDNPESKVNKAAVQIKRIYDQWRQDKGAQLVFLDLSTPKSAKGKATAQAQETPETEVSEEESIAKGEEETISMDDLLADQSGFSVYDDLRGKLIKGGIPANEIAFIHDYDTADKKRKLFASVRRGDIRVLFGSTGKMGAGMNVQERLVGLHHIDAPWRPSDLEQREGRILRQGNKLYERDPAGFEVELLRYATKQTYDTRMWQLIEHKANGVEQLRRGDATVRVVEDVGGEAANAGEMKAAASGNPLIEQEIKLRTELNRLESLDIAFKRNKHTIENNIASALRSEKFYITRAGNYERAAKSVLPKDTFSITIGGKRIDDPKALTAKHIGDEITAAVGKDEGNPIAYRGVEFKFNVQTRGDMRLASLHALQKDIGEASLFSYGPTDEISASGFIARLNNWIDGLADVPKSSRDEAKRDAQKAKDLAVELKKEFKQTADLDRVRTAHREIIAQLKAGDQPQAAAPQAGAGDNFQADYSSAPERPFSSGKADDKKSFTKEQVAAEARKAFGYSVRSLEQIHIEGRKQAESIIARTQEKFLDWLEAAAARIENTGARDAFQINALSQMSRLRGVLDMAGVGAPITLRSGGKAVDAIVTRIDVPSSEGAINLDQWKITVALPNGNRSATLPVSQLSVRAGAAKYEIQPAALFDTAEQFHRDEVHATNEALDSLRRHMEMMTGRPIARNAYTSAPVDHFIQKIAEAVGWNVKGFQLAENAPARTPIPNGVQRGNEILLNAESKRPHLAVLGHELTHLMRQEHPELYDQFVDAAWGYVKNAPYQAYHAEKVSSGYGRVNKDLDDVVKEEFVADLMADALLQPGFYDSLARRNPSLLQRVIELLREVIARVKAKIIAPNRTTVEGERMRPYLHDYDRALVIAQGVMRRYANRAVARKATGGINFDMPTDQPRAQNMTVRSYMDQVATAQTGLQDWVATAMHSDRSLTPWMRSVGTPFHQAAELAKQGKPQYKRVFDLVQKFLRDINVFAIQAENKAPNLLHKINTPLDVGKGAKPADIASIADPLYRGTFSGGGSPMEGIKWTREELMGQDTPRTRRARVHFALTDKQADLYFEALAATDEAVRETAKALIAKHAKTVGIPFDRDMTLEDMAATVGGVVQQNIEMNQEELAINRAGRDEIIANVRATQGINAAAAQERRIDDRISELEGKLDSLIKLRGDILGITNTAVQLAEHGYFTASRFGKHAVTGKNAAGRTTYFSMHEWQANAKAEARELKEAYPDWE